MVIISTKIPLIIQNQIRSISWRSFVPRMQFLVNRWNDVDWDRVTTVGPDQAAAEWAVRNGAKIKWLDSAEFEDNYDEIIKKEKVETKIEAIQAINASVNWQGMKHLDGCSQFHEMLMQNCEFIDDLAIEELMRFAPNLKRLVIDDCPVSNKISYAISSHRNLRYLSIRNMKPKMATQVLMAQPNYIYERIRTHDPKTKIEFDWQKLDPILEQRGAKSKRMGF